MDAIWNKISHSGGSGESSEQQQQQQQHTQEDILAALRNIQESIQNLNIKVDRLEHRLDGSNTTEDANARGSAEQMDWQTPREQMTTPPQNLVDPSRPDSGPDLSVGWGTSRGDLSEIIQQQRTLSDLAIVASPTARRPSAYSPKTMMIMMAEEAKEDQQTALYQIGYCFQERRPCPACSKQISASCFRRHHFNWCTTHELMTDEGNVCPQSPSRNAAVDVLQCQQVQCDKADQEAYWD